MEAQKAAVHVILTEADMLHLGAQDRRFEVIDGEIVDMSPVGILHVIIAMNAYDLLRVFLRSTKLGYVFPDSLIYVLEDDAKAGIRRTRIPDVSFIRRERLPAMEDRGRPFYGAPNLAVEVVSPGEGAEELQSKIQDYFMYGTEQMWVIYPDLKELHQYIQGVKEIRIYKSDDTLDGGSLLPGFILKISDLFIHPDEIE